MSVQQEESQLHMESLLEGQHPAVHASLRGVTESVDLSSSMDDAGGRSTMYLSDPIFVKASHSLTEIFCTGYLLYHRHAADLFYKPNPIADSYSVTAMLLFLAAAWLGVMVMNTEPAKQYQLLVLHAGSRRKVVTSQLICAWIMQFMLTVITVLYPVFAGMFERQPTGEEWMMTWLGHMGLSLLGLGIKCIFSKIVHSLA